MNEKIVLAFLDVPKAKETYVTVPLSSDRTEFARIIDGYFVLHPTCVLTGVRIGNEKPDIVMVTCYKNTKAWDRADALAFFRAGVDACEGSERERYMNIVRQLESGATECSDERR